MADDSKGDAPGVSYGEDTNDNGGSSDPSNAAAMAGDVLDPDATADPSSIFSPSGLKRSGFSEPEDVEQSQKKVKTGTPDEKPAANDDDKPEEQPLTMSPLPAHGQAPEHENGNDNNGSHSKDPPAAEQQDSKDPPSTPNNQPIGGRGGAGTAEQQHPGMPPQQAHMGYPPGSHQMMGGMMHQYPPGMMQAYYPHHGYPPQAMMMGQPHMGGQPHAMQTGSPTPANPSGQPPSQQGQPGQQQQGFYGQQPGTNDGTQQSPPASQNQANRPPGAHPQAGFQQMPGMMPMGMQMPMHMMHYGPPGMFFSQYPMPGMMNPMMAQAFGGNPNNPAASGRGHSGAQAAPYLPPVPPRNIGTPLSLSCDDEQLSEYQMLVRKQLEIFEAQPEDVESNTQGRKKQVVLGQVGIRCRHCAGFPLRQRGRGAVYYPAKLNGVYQAAQNMASSHLCESCQCIPPQLKCELRTLRDRRDTASGGKQYWADGARAMGLQETDEGLRLRRPDVANAQSPPS